MERSFVMLKPDAVQRKITGQIISRFENKGLTLIAMKMIHISEELANKHYDIHKGKPFYESLIKFITSSPVIATVWEGENAIKTIRNIVGATNPQDATPGSIRGDFALSMTFNMIHASDAPDTAEKEISLFFDESELIEYSSTVSKWIIPE
jgi:nucleoside-diphosphate kinase